MANGLSRGGVLLDKSSTSHNCRDVNLANTATLLCYCGRARRPHTFFCSDECRFWEKVRKGPGCWLWTASRTKNSTKQQQGKRSTFLYGQFTRMVDGAQQHIGAHRYSFELAYGPVPDGLEIMHSCHNMACVNPAHLSAGTHLENVRQSARSGNLHVSRPTRQKLTPEQVECIRTAVLDGPRGTANLMAEKFGISRTLVSLIVKGKRRQYDAPITSTTQQEGAA